VPKDKDKKKQSQSSKKRAGTKVKKSLGKSKKTKKTDKSVKAKQQSVEEVDVADLDDLESAVEEMSESQKAAHVHERALQSFFVTEDEMRSTTDSMSLDLYREQLDGRMHSEGVQEYLSFYLGKETYAVNIFNIKEIIKVPMITEIPRTEPVIMGVLSLRGTIASVVDLRLRLGLEDIPATRKSRILIVQMQEELVGLLVDEVRHVIRLRDDEIEPPPGVFDRAEAEHIVGVGRYDGDMYILLDLESVVELDKYIRQ
jgi:chemotaxis signal transduction protein